MAEGYQVLARKWRPQLFAELAGLEHIARTLQNAIRRERVGHAFIFTGSRGVGKTSAARILAKALNCAKGPAVEPCNQCENCIAVTAGNSADVIEIDGASNRGVGEIRLLRDNVSYLPQSSPYKIYIIDEVHMLTTEAFNALLKTLEEPPNHVKFIMATTDVHKVPMTILSRCQRFDFGRLTGATIAATLTEIGDRENLTFASGAAELLAREAQGSMRDALSLLDQARSYAGETISIDDLRSALGLIEARHSFTLLEKVVTGDLSAAVTLVNDLEQAGVDLKKFSEEFLFYLRDALFLKLSGDLKGLLGISVDEIELLEPLVATNALPFWQQIFDLWQKHYSQIKISQTPRLALEMALIELGMARDLLPVDELLGRIERHLKVVPPALVPGTPSQLRKDSGKTTAGSPGALAKAAAPGLEPRSQEAVCSDVPSVAEPRERVVRPELRSPESASPKSAPQVSGSRPTLSSPSHPKAPVAAGDYRREELAVVKPVVAESVPLKESYGSSEMPPQAPPPDDYGEASFFDGDNGQRPELSELVVAETSAKVAIEKKTGSEIPVRASLKPEKIDPVRAQPENARAEKNNSEKVNLEKKRGERSTGSGSSEVSQEQVQWATFLERLASKDARLGAMLQRSRLQPAGAGNLMLEVAPHALALLDQESVKQNILSLWSEFKGQDETLVLQLRAATAAAGSQTSDRNGAPASSGRPRPLPSKEEIFNDPAVRFVSDRFGGRVTEIKARK